MEITGFMRQLTLFSDRLHYRASSSGKLKKANISFSSLRRNREIGTADVHYLSFKHDSRDDDKWLMFSRVQFVGSISGWNEYDRRYLCSHGCNPTLSLILLGASLSAQQEITLVDTGVNRQRSKKLDRLKFVVNQSFKVVSWEVTATNEMVDNSPAPYTIAVSCNGVTLCHHDDRSRLSYFSFGQNRFSFTNTSHESRLEITRLIDQNIVATLKYKSQHAQQLYTAVTNNAPLQNSINNSSYLSNGHVTLGSSFATNSIRTDWTTNQPIDGLSGDFPFPSPSPCLGLRENNIFVGVKESNNNDVAPNMPPTEIGEETVKKGDQKIDKNNRFLCGTNNNGSIMKKFYFTKFDLYDQSVSSEAVRVTISGESDTSSVSSMESVEGTIKLTQIRRKSDCDGLNNEETSEKGLYAGGLRLCRNSSNTRPKCLHDDDDDDDSAETRVKETIDGDTSEFSRYQRFSKLIQRRNVRAMTCAGRPPACRLSYVHVWAGSAQASHDCSPLVSFRSNCTSYIYRGATDIGKNPTTVDSYRASSTSRLLAALDLHPVVMYERRLRSLSVNRSTSETALSGFIESGTNLPRRSPRCSCDATEMCSATYMTWDFHQEWRSMYIQDTWSDNNSTCGQMPEKCEGAMYACVRDSALHPSLTDPYWSTNLCFTLQSILDRVPPLPPDSLNLTWRSYVPLRFALLANTDLIEGWEGLASRIGLVLHEIQMIEHFAYHSQTTPLDIILRHWQLMHNTREEHPLHSRYPPCTMPQLMQIFQDMGRNDLVMILEQANVLDSLNDLNRTCHALN